MPAGIASPTLSHRLIDRYLMCGLGGVFAFLALAISLAWRGAFTEFVAVTAVLPMLMLLIGAFVLRRTVRVSEAIEGQLRNIAAVSSTLDAGLHPLADCEPVALGWNAVLERLRDQRILAALETRLDSSVLSLEGKRWETIVNHLPDGVAVCDAGLQVTLANRTLAAILGTESSASVKGRRIIDLLADSLLSERPAALEELGTGTGKLTRDFLKGSRLMDGVWRVSRYPLGDDALGKDGTLWTIRDVTQQKLAEESRNQFVYTATHELRTPLANIKAYAETLAEQDGIDEEGQKGFYNIINSEATRLARFVDELLNVSQLEAGSIMLARHETDVERLLQEVVAHVQPQVEQKRLRFDAHFPPKLPKLQIDKGKMTAALVNLLGNAVKYTPEEGHVQLTVEADSSQVQFHVDDSGCGISPADLSRIGEKFFRSADERVQALPGSGLGLAYTQEVARLHGGKLLARSELNKGSRFSICLPLA